MHRFLLGTLLLAGCGCPRALCNQWVVLRVDAIAWSLGTYRIDAVAGDAEIHCTIAVVDGHVPPRPGDVTCNDSVLKDSFQFDTAGMDSAGAEGPGVVELRVVTGHGATLPDGLQVTASFEAHEASTPLIDRTLLLDWRTRPGASRSCVTGCFTAIVPLTLPTP